MLSIECQKNNRSVLKKTIFVIVLPCLFLFLGCAAAPKPVSSRQFTPVSKIEAKSVDAEKEEKEREKEILEMSKITKNKVFTEEFGISEYIIGPGDVLEISLWEGTEEKKHTMTVRSDGNISISFLEDVNVSGLTARQVDKTITERLADFVKNPRVDVLIKEFVSKKTQILGEVNIIQGTSTTQPMPSGPGNYPLKGKTTIIDLLVTAGGAKTTADLKRTRLVRGGKTYTVNLYRTMFQGDTSQNIILDAGDMIIIPEYPTTQDKVFVLGEVKSPGAYSFKHEIDLVTALSLAGGYTYDAKEKNILVIRGYPAKTNVLVANLKDFLKQGDFSQNISLQSGDVVYVPRSVIGDIHYYVSRLTPMLDFALYPATYRDAYTTGGGLRINTGAP
ncbi:MAG: polysaccharide biosynthesis/export family protein [Thermodesulfobacteriota bacterium]